MEEVTFIFNQSPLKILCNKTDYMREICKKFSYKIKISLKDLVFLYQGESIDYQLTFEQQVRGEDKRAGKMKILAYSNEKAELYKFTQSKEIICPECGDICFMNIKDYKINFYECRKGHKIDNILLSNFNRAQTINISKIVFYYLGFYQVRPNPNQHAVEIIALEMILIEMI